mgnify:FL=1
MTTDDVSPLLDWTGDGEPRSGRFGDVYFSRDDGLAESRAVFLAGCGLPEAWERRQSFTVAELGFGTGLNIAALLTLWRRHRPQGGRLHVFSIEGFPLTAEEAGRALSNWPEVAEAARALTHRWPPGTPGFHRVDLPEFHAVLDLAVGDAAWALQAWSGLADAWFLDGFSPSLNPGMWSPEVLDGVAARSAPGARLATFTVAGLVRRGLAQRGFGVEKRPGHGRKRERLEARLPGDPVTSASSQRVAVVGAGIAGAATSRALAALGADVMLVEGAQPGAGGSGFPAGLVTPRLDAGDLELAALYAQALERAAHLYEAVPAGVIAHGVLQLPHAPRDVARFEKIAAQALWPQGAMQVINAGAASAWLGDAVDTGGLMMRDARVIRPLAAVETWLTGVERVTATVARLERREGSWRLLDGDDHVIVEAGQVVLAAGWGSAALLPGGPSLTPVRGQADWVEGVAAGGTAWGGYAAPTGEGLLFGATHDRGQTGVDVRAEDSARNRETLRARAPGLASQVEGAAAVHARAAVRATTADRLPVAGRLDEGLWMLGGLGSRGLCLAPLLGEHVAAQIAGTPSPLPRRQAARIAPDRAAIRP